MFDVEKRTFVMKTYKYLPPNKAASGSSEDNTAAERRRSSKKTALFQGRKMTQKDAIAYERANFFLGEKLVKNSKKAYALFEIVYPKLLKRFLDPETLTVTLGRKGEPINVSLIDYVATLTDPQREPTELVSLFHKYLLTVRRVSLPTTFLANKRFW